MRNFIDRIPPGLFSIFVSLLLILILIFINDQVFKEEIQELRQYQQNVCDNIHPDYKNLGVICPER